MNNQPADLILHNSKIATQDDRRSIAEAAAIRDGRFLAVGSDREVMRWRGECTKVIDLNKRTVIPGLNDSHLHLIRGGLNYNLELRWTACWFAGIRRQLQSIYVVVQPAFLSSCEQAHLNVLCRGRTFDIRATRKYNSEQANKDGGARLFRRRGLL